MSGRMVVIAALAAVVVAGANGAVPKQLLGRYHRTISAAALARTTYPQAAGRWSLTFKKDGTVLAQGPAATGVSGYLQASATGPGLLTIRDKFCTPRSGTYRWRLVGPSLTFAKANDACGDRTAILVGVWKRG
jgi:hypothetical protein